MNFMIVKTPVSIDHLPHAIDQQGSLFERPVAINQRSKPMQVGGISHLRLGQRKKFVGFGLCEFELFTDQFLNQRLLLLTQIVISHRGFIHKRGCSKS